MAELLNIKRDEYDEIKAVNFSTLKHIEGSALNYLYERDHKKPPTSAMGFGTVCHVAHLEPEIYDAGKVIVESNRGTKGFEKESALYPNSFCVTANEDQIIRWQRQAFKKNKSHDLFFSGEQKVEHAIAWKDPETGLTCKGIIDLFVESAVVDLKTSAYTEEHLWLNQFYGKFYHAQIVMYHDALKELDGRDRACVIVKLETTPPYDVVPYVLPNEVVVSGRNTYCRWLWRLKTCWEAGTYPGLALGGLRRLPIRKWALEAQGE